MMRKSILIFTLACLVHSVYGQTSANNGLPKFAPDDGKKLFVVGQDLGAVGGLQSHSSGYVDQVDTQFPSGVTSYTDIPNLKGLKFQTNWGSGDVNAAAYDDESFDDSFIVIGLYMVNRLQGIVDGIHDSGIEKFAEWVKDQPKPVFIRIGYEFEGSWNSYQPTLFKNAWKHIVHVFDRLEVKNAAYVWQSAGLNNGNIENWYPGDEYVNWVGFSHFESLSSGKRMEEFAAKHDKPIMIAEAAPRVDLKSVNGELIWRNWYLPLFNRIYDNDQIKALAYINVNWDAQSMWRGQGWGDSRVQVNEFVKNTWTKELAKSPWLMSSDTLFQSLELDQWLSSTTTSSEEIKNELIIEIAQKGDQLSIQSVSGEELGVISIYDINGVQHYRGHTNAGTMLVSLPNLPAGILVTIIENDKSRQVESLIWKRI